jgi:hypothetical protein
MYGHKRAQEDIPHWDNMVRHLELDYLLFGIFRHHPLLRMPWLSRNWSCVGGTKCVGHRWSQFKGNKKNWVFACFGASAPGS